MKILKSCSIPIRMQHSRYMTAQWSRTGLLDMLFDDPDDEPKKSGWLAYTPPPLMVPMDYQDTTKWNRWETKYVSGIFVSAVVVDRANWLSQNDVSEAQFGDLKEFDGGEIRGFRLGVVGTLNFEKPWVYTFFASHQRLR